MIYSTKLTVNIKGVTVLRTLVSTAAEEIDHLSRLSTEHQFASTHDCYSAEDLYMCKHMSFDLLD